MRKHAVIVAHPNIASFNLALAKRYCEGVEKRGGQAVLRDLYRLGFDPCLKNEEIPRPQGFSPSDDIDAERTLLADTSVFAFIYPLWFNAPPAMLVGYVQRVFGMGFGYGPQRAGGNTKLLLGRSMISFSSSGAPSEWLRTEGGFAALRNLFDDHVAGVCGLTVLDHRHYGRVLAQTPAPSIEAHFRDLEATLNHHFGAGS